MKKIKDLTIHNEKGNILIFSLIIFTLLSLFVIFLLRTISLEYLAVKGYEERVIALNLAEAGVEKAIWELSRQGSSYQGEPDTELGKGGFKVKIRQEENETEIISTGYLGKRTGRTELRVRVRNDGRELKIESWKRFHQP